ncbi:S8/S53 family peptidase [Pseudenhygromyxa sp. WMMC2535]|uniref:S8/S53 family peptidase n=1 Tax=Pseudenhygromyxa sp. WMMC2535 TaxID=2712867 RepID=UPI001595FF52|nr:S8/S53 family peptidase [Pseudenhygromyxa sp. WMMC2535]NVB39489.1 S8/S53 family peptidase [Pseudenhygromyxa sp. WMMC2535]
MPSWHIEWLSLVTLGERGRWGAGFEVALLDSGAAPVSGTMNERFSHFSADGQRQSPRDRRRDFHGTMAAGALASDDVHTPGVATGARCACFDVYGSLAKPVPWRVARALEVALERGVDVVCCPFSLPQLSPELRRALERAARLGVPVIVAQGNDGDPGHEFPERARGVIAVAASNERGRVLPGRIGPWTTIAAPGWKIIARTPGGSEYFNGTSAAAPVLAGVVTLALGYARARGGEGLERWLRHELVEVLRRSAIHGGGVPILNAAGLFEAINQKG